MLAPVLAAADVEVDWGALAAALVCVVAGHAVGRRAFARIDAARYEPLLLAIVVAAGAASIVAGVDHCFHLIEQPTGSVSAGSGAAPASTASSAPRSQAALSDGSWWSASGAPR